MKVLIQFFLDMSQKCQFITITIIITVLVGLFAIGYNCHYKTECETVIETAQTNNDSLHQYIIQHSVMLSDSTFVIDHAVCEYVKMHDESIEKLLSIQYDRLQAERNIIEIWTAILTIVFLIFSFYAIFNMNEIQKEAKQGLDDIREYREQSNKEKTTIRKELNEIADPIKERLGDYSKDISFFNNLTTRMDDINSRLSNLENRDNDDESDESDSEIEGGTA